MDRSQHPRLHPDKQLCGREEQPRLFVADGKTH
jgi:hypothetical protein